MPVVQREGDLFTTNADVIGHGVSKKCDFARGIAAQIKTKYPAAYDAYLERIPLVEKGALIIAERKEEVDKTILNMVIVDTKQGTGTMASYVAIHDAVKAAIQYVATQSTVEHIKPILALPHLGCGHGGLGEEGWKVVEAIIRGLSQSHRTVEVEVWKHA